MTTNQPTSRGLDQQIAEKVMGWRTFGGKLQWVVMEPRSDLQKGYVTLSLVPHFSTNPADARLVLERMRELGWWVTIDGTKSAWWVGVYKDSSHIEAAHESLETAICLAALAAVGQKPT